MIVGLFLEAVKHVSTRVQIQNQVDLCVTFVDFLQTDDIGMVALGHDKNFFSKTLNDFIGLDCQYIEEAIIRCYSKQSLQPVTSEQASVGSPAIPDWVMKQ